MRVVIAGAGSVGRSIARELLGNGHQVLLIDKDADDVQASRVPEASWLLADACELAAGRCLRDRGPLRGRAGRVRRRGGGHR